MRALGDLGVISRDRARNDDVVIHGVPLSRIDGGRFYYLHYNI
jgi:hypothetical protein